VTVTNSLNNECLNDFTVSGASGAARTCRVENTNNTGGSNAISEVYVGGTSAGDPYVRHTVGSSHSYALGIDNSDSDRWKLSHASDATATPSSADNILNVTTGGTWRRPMTPLFEAYVGTNITLVQNQTIVFDQENFDQGSNFDVSTGRYTCPVAGTYVFFTSIAQSLVTATNNNGYIYIYHSGSSLNQSANIFNPSLCRDASNLLSFFNVLVYNAAASDYFSITVENDTAGGAETTTVLADESRFSGYLLG